MGIEGVGAGVSRCVTEGTPEGGGQREDELPDRWL